MAVAGSLLYCYWGRLRCGASTAARCLTGGRATGGVVKPGGSRLQLAGEQAANGKCAGARTVDYTGAGFHAEDHSHDSGQLIVRTMAAVPAADGTIDAAAACNTHGAAAAGRV